MSILVKGMEMPKSCAECPVNMNICKRGYKYLLAHMELYDQRADDCPIIPVPPHGRLIDASESIRVEFYDEEHEDWTRHDMTIDDLLSQSWVDADAPTIIPAEPCNNLSKPCKEDEP